MKASIILTFLLTATLVATTGRAAEPSKAKPDAAEKEAAAKPFKNVNVAEFDKLRADTNNVVLDVRTKQEFANGHVPGAINVDVNGADFPEKIAQLDKGKTYLVHCASGRRSVSACNKLAPLKFDHLYNLEGGYTAWTKAGNKGEK